MKRPGRILQEDTGNGALNKMVNVITELSRYAMTL